MRYLLTCFFVASLMYSCNSRDARVKRKTDNDKVEQGVHFVEIPSENKVEVWIKDELFTNYIYPDEIKKPVLYPIYSSGGNTITRGFPLDTIPGERIDHPHQVGFWMNYGDVNGIDFWNNSSTRPLEDSHLYGSIEHVEVSSIQEKEKEGILAVENVWRTADGDVFLDEHSVFVFGVSGASRTIDRIVTWRARGDSVIFKDSKEGMFAVRVARALELPSGRGDFLMGEDGRPGDVKVVDSSDVTGKYLSSEGLEGDAVWGSRARWVELYGVIADEDVSLVIFDHPSNVGYPTFWMARGYGLFAANPLGHAAYTDGEQELNFRLGPFESVSFHYRLLIHSGQKISPEYIHKMADEFAME